jgi:glycine cleavage system H protein
MSNIPNDLKYTKSHEWVRLNSDGTVTVGITDHAQHALGDMVYVELPAAGKVLTAGKECAVTESVKSASDTYSPISGEVVAINEALSSNAGLLNQDPYGAGWLFKVKPSDPKELDNLMDAKTYEAYSAE